jgi:hypothetical protein
VTETARSPSLQDRFRIYSSVLLGSNSIYLHSAAIVDFAARAGLRKGRSAGCYHLKANHLLLELLQGCCAVEFFSAYFDQRKDRTKSHRLILDVGLS